MGYALIADIHTPGVGVTRRFLTTDDTWALATNSARKFLGPQGASEWYRLNPHVCDQLPCGQYVYILGPRGALYYAANGKRVR